MSGGELEQTLDYLRTNLHNLSRKDKQKALEVIHQHNVVKARTDFYVFVCLMAEQFMGQAFETGPHIKLICKEYQDLYEATASGSNRRVQVSVPPRSMKTVLTCLFIAWVFGKKPFWKILHISHSQSLIEDVAGRPIRDLIKTFEYQAIFPKTELKKDSRSAKRWETTAGGIYICAGVDGKVAGRGANILIGDDMLADASARSKTEREKVNRSYMGTYRSRIWKYGSELMIGTRWHIDDLLGYLQKLDGTIEKPIEGSNTPWKVIKIPAILDKETAELLGLEEGQSYWPETKPLDLLLDTKRAAELSNPMEWSALYMQTPTIEEGNIFKRNMFKVWPLPDPPDLKFVICSIDPAFSTRESADFSAFTIWGVFERQETVKFGPNTGREIKVNHLILLHALKGRWSYVDLFDKIEEFREAYDPDIFVVENKASGTSIIQELLRRGWPCHGYTPTQDKITRAHMVTPFLVQGRIHLPKFGFSNALLEEMLCFPNVSHDDLTDAAVYALLYLRDTFEITSNKWKDETENEAFDQPDHHATNHGRRSYWGLVAA